MHWLLFLIATLGWEEMMRRHPAAERPTDQVSQSAPAAEKSAAPEPRPKPEPGHTPEAPPPQPRSEPDPPRTQAPATAPQATAPAALPVRPTVYRLADSSGQVWTHTNPDWLRQWVAQRNQSLATPAAPGGSLAPWFSQTFGACPPGGCTH